MTKHSNNDATPPPTWKPRTPRSAAAATDVVSTVVQEYNKKISELALLTAELPQRLEVNKFRTPRFSSDPLNASRIASSDPVTKPINHAVPTPFQFSQANYGQQNIEPDTEFNGHCETCEVKVKALVDSKGDSKVLPAWSPSAQSIAASRSKLGLDIPVEKQEIPFEKQDSLALKSETRSVSSSPSSPSRRISHFESRLRDAMTKFVSVNSNPALDTSEWAEVAINVCQCCPCVKRYYPRKSNKDSKEKPTDPVALMFQGARSEKFDLVVGILILANCVTMMVQLEYVGYQSEVSLGERHDDGSWPHAKEWFNGLEHFFNALFILELVTRFAMYGRSCLRDKHILVDIVLVSGSSLQLYVLDPLQGAGGDGVNISIFRMLRFIKFVRIFRLVRVLRLFSDLRVLVNTIISSFGSLVWSMILLVIIMLMSGLLLSELLKDFIIDQDNDIVQRKWVFKHYGTSTRATYTLFEVTLAGCWPNYFRPLIDYVSGYYVLFAVSYISIVVFAIIRIITAIFLKETLLIASNDAEMMVQERLRQKEIYVKKLECIFRAVDTSGDGRLSNDEFLQIVQNPHVQMWLQVLELEVHDAQALFNLLDDGDGEVTYEEFLRGVLRLKGQARTMDIVAIMHSTERTMEAVRCLKDQMTDLPGDILSVLQDHPSGKAMKC